MAITTPRTRNLKLYLSNGLTVEAKQNLELIDKLGETFASDNTNSLFIRQKQDIHLLPGDPSVGGTAGQGNLFFGSATSPVNNLKIFTTNFEVTGSFTLKDLSSAGKLTLQYDSSSTSPGADAAPRTLTIDVQGANRVWTLGGNLQIAGDLSLQGPSSPGVVSFPFAGNVVVDTAAQILQNKTLDCTINTIQNLTQTAFASGTNLPLSIINGGNVSSAQFSTLQGVTSSIQGQLDGKQPLGPYITGLTGAIVAAGPGSVTAVLSPNAVSSSNIQPGAVQDLNVGSGIGRNKLAAGNALHVLLNDSAGNMSSAAFLPLNRGGTGVDNSLVTFPNSGIVATSTNNVAFSNKSIDGDFNLIENVPYNGLILTGSILNTDINTAAAIEYSKLNLTSSITNSDISNAAAISGLKVSPSFGSQLIKTAAGLEISGSSFKTLIQTAPIGQTADTVFSLPPNMGTAGYFMSTDGAGQLQWVNPGFGGTVTSVGLSAPGEFIVTNSPVTTAGNLSLAWQNVLANRIFCGPSTGVAAPPSFRTLVAADMPLHTHWASDIVDLTEAVQDTVGDLVVTSPSLSWTYSDSPGTLSATVSLAPFNTANLAEGSSLYFTQERAQDAVFGAFTGSGDVLVSYDDITNTASVSAKDALVTSKPIITPALGDTLLLSDVSNGGTLSQVAVSDIIALVSSGSSAGVAANWTSLNGSSRTVVHNLGTRDVFVQIYDNITYEEILVDSVIRLDTMTVVLTAAEAPSTSWRVLVKPL